MSPSTDATPDPEAPRPPAPSGRACRPLDWALGAALLLLTATCAATYATRFWVAPGAPALPSPTSSPRLPELPRLPPGDIRAGLPARPQGGFAQLVASDVLLTNGPLHWYSDSRLAGVSLARGLRYDARTQELVVAAAGIYYVFLRLELQRVVVGVDRGSGLVVVTVQRSPANVTELKLTVTLPSWSSSEAAESAVGSRGRLLRLGAGQRLSVHLNASGAATSSWQFAQSATTLGLFLVAAEDPSGLPSPRPT